MENVKKGKKIVIGIIVSILLFDIVCTAVISLLYANHGKLEYATFKSIQGIVRLIFTGTILFFLYKGHKWAKWLISILLILSALITIVSLITTFNLYILIMGIFYLGTSFILISSSSVKVFLKNQRGEILEEDTCDDIGNNM